MGKGRRGGRRWRLSLILFSLSVAVVASSGPKAEAQSDQRVLRVGVVDGAQPCSFRREGVWRGLAVDLWSRVEIGRAHV